MSGPGVHHIVRGRTTPIPTRTMQAHTRSVWAAAFFEDGRRVVTCSSDRTLRIWDVERGAQVGWPFEGHSDKVYSVAVSPDNRRIASGGRDKTTIIWDVESKQKVFNPLVKHRGRVNSVCFSPDGKRLASGSSDRSVVVWNTETGAALSTFWGHDVVWSVAFSPDGLKLSSGSLRVIRVWRTDNAEIEVLRQINADEVNDVRGVVWSPDGQQLVSASNDKVKFWDSNGYQIGQPCAGPPSKIYSIAISSDGSFVATTSLDKTVRLWSTSSHQQIGEPLEHTAEVSCVTLSPNGQLLVSGDREGNVWLWSTKITLPAATELYSTSGSYFAHRSQTKLERNLFLEALSDAEKFIDLNHSSYLGYELKQTALHGAERYDDAFEAFKTMLSKLDNAPDTQMRKLHQKHISALEVMEATVRRAIHAHLENAPLRLIDTFAGRLCNRDGQIDAFMESTEYKKLLSPWVMYGPLKMEPIEEAVAKYFSWVMLSHRWDRKEPLLHDIQHKIIYNLDPVGTVVKLQKFCKVARDAGHRWAWSDTCCIDQNNNVELQESVNSMFVWYHHSVLTIIYLSDVPPFSRSGALANSIWNTRGWTVQEFLAPSIVLFYQADWTLYLDTGSTNHKESVAIMQELEDSTGINTRALVAFRPGMRGAREKLQWASSRVTTLQEDIAYSLFGIFGVHLPVIYGEKKQNALGRLLQEIIAHSGDITALDWVGQSSNFNSCLPADIVSYKAPPCSLPSLSEDKIQASVSQLRYTVAVESASKLYALLDNISAPRFANSRLQLPCIAFPVTELRRRHGHDQETCFAYYVKADGLRDLLIMTEDKLTQFSPARPVQQSFLLIRPWNRYDLELPDFTNETQNADDWPEPGYPSDDPLGQSPKENDPADSCSHPQELSLLVRLGRRFGAPPRQPRDNHLADSQSHSQALRLLVRLGQSFGALLLAQQRGGEYKRIASDHNIVARVKDIASVDAMMGVRTLEIL